MSDIIKEAYNSFNKKKYSEVINILEPQVFRFRENFNFFYMLGMSCLYQGDYGGASSYLRRAIDIRENDVNTLLGIAAVYLKRGDTGNALRIWLEVTELSPDNIYAQRGLNYLKKNGNPDDFISLGNQDKISRFIPSGEKSRKKPIGIALSLIILIAAVSLLLIIPPSRNFIANRINLSIIKPNKSSLRPEIPVLALDEKKDFIDLNNDFTFILTEEEIENKMQKIQDYLYEYRDNPAKKEINIILMSNASEYIKDRARILEKYIQTPNLINFKDNFTYSDVKSSPSVFEGCFVLWKGKAANVSESSEKISFDFLVGYHEEKTLEGSLPVNFDFAVKIIPDQPIEILGKVELSEDGILFLRGIAIHRL